jgi:selenocysteine lyase/cysteine desulfurase
MNEINTSQTSSTQIEDKSAHGYNQKEEAFNELGRGIFTALETYSNVHRGSGHNSMVTTHLYEKARDIVLEYLGLKKGKYVVIFCTLRRSEVLKSILGPGSYHCVSSQDIGLPLGVRALAVVRKALPKGIPFQTGGGSASLISPGQVIWAGAPDKFEAGTPAIINIIAFARTLRLIRKFGIEDFHNLPMKELSAKEILFHDELEEFSGRKLLDELRQTLIGRGVQVPTAEGDKPFINLDNGASTPTFTPVWNTVCQAWRQPEKVQQEIIREVRSICAGVLGAPSSIYNIIFTSNTTEAINLVAESLNHESEKGTQTVVLNTLLEHSSNELPWRMYPSFSQIRLTVDKEGFIDLKELDDVMCAYNKDGRFGTKRIKIVAMSGASNVLGTFNDLEEISRVVHKYGAHLLVDAAQMVAHREVDMDGCGIDYLAFSAHKVYAPFGTGVLIVRKGLLHFSPSELELINSSGEENPGGIAALGKALVLLKRIGLDLIRPEEQALTARALRGLAQIPGVTIYGVKEPDSPRFTNKGGVIIFALKGIMPNILARQLAEQGGIGVRYGCHCAHLLIKHLLKVSPRLQRFQGIMLTVFPKIRLPGLTRISLGLENTEDEIDTFLQVLSRIAKNRRNSMKAEIKKQIKGFIDVIERKVFT